MAAREWRIEGLDSLFFRGGQPFNAGESGYVASLFPPTPETVQGFVRTMVMRENRIPYGDLSRLGGLQLRGPFLAQERSRLFPAPLHLGRRSESRGGGLCFLTPGEPLSSDLDSASLPGLGRDAGGFESCAGMWVTREGLAGILAGQVPEEGALRTLRRPDRLFLRKDAGDPTPKPTVHCLTPERRVGIALDRERRAVQEGMLYAIELLRPAALEAEGPWWEVRALQIGVLVDGLDEELQLQDGTYSGTLGGEGRLIELQVTKADTLLRDAAGLRSTSGSARFVLALLTPADFDGSWLPRDLAALGNECNLNGIGVKVVSACVGRPVRIGGWEMAPRDNGRPKSKPTQACVPAGSVYFCECSAGAEAAVQALHGQQIGGRKESGYGWCVVGAWPEEGGQT